MKKQLLPFISFLVFTGLIIFNNGCKNEINKTDYLNKVLKNLEKISSASYHSVMSFNLPGDTTRFTTYIWIKKEFENKADTTIGSSFAWFYPEDDSKMYLYYDGSARGHLDSDRKTVTIDSFKTNTLPFRPVGSPFFNKAKNILKYALETNDSISTELKDFGDSIRFILYIPHRVKYFFGKAVEMDNPYLLREDAFTRYEIWIDKSEGLPYKIIDKMPHNSGFEACNNLKLNKIRIEDFRPSDYFPPDYEVKVRGQQQRIFKDLTGKTAPDWTLTDYSENSIGLKNLHSKVLLIEFTGIGCAPCHAAIPFIKQLVKEHEGRDFEFVSIETWGNDIEGLKRYHKNNELNYNLLKASENIVDRYEVSGVPAFYILDRNHVIMKIITGYEKGTTDKEIRNAIKELI
ncbi:MAG TPA: TlpA disulfide reductase family protein [Bacteroidales bacterium]|nr:TlpA disulfide reductase family protein [Bacteroidales bacterium]